MDPEIEYQNELMSYLRSVILPLCFTPDMPVASRSHDIDLLTSPSSVPMWIAAFTDCSVDPNPARNYERLEKLGDKALKLAFEHFLLRRARHDPRYASLDASQIAELDRNYMSEDYQTLLSKELGLDRFIRCSLKRARTPLHDVLESLFGAIFLVADDNLTAGDSYVLCINLVARVFAENPIDMALAERPPVNQVKEFWDKVGFGGEHKRMERLVANDDGSVTYSLVVPADAFEEMSSYLESATLASETRRTKKQAYAAAYATAALLLKKRGIDKAWADHNQAARISVGWTSQLFARAYARAASNGFGNARMSPVAIRQDAKFVLLLADDATGCTVLLKTAEDSTTISNRALCVRLAQSYLLDDGSYVQPKLIIELDIDQ